MQSEKITKELSLDIKFFAAILDHAPLGINIFELLDEEGPEFRYKYVNEEQCKITGFNLKKYVGSSIRQVFPSFYEEDAKLPNFCFQALKEGKKMEFGEFEYGDGDKDIESKTYRVTCIPLNETLVIVCSEDVEELKMSQDSLQKTNQKIRKLNYRLEKITETSPEIIYVYDIQQQQTVYANRSLVFELGYTEAEVQNMGNQFFPLTIHPDDLPNVYTHHSKVLPNLDDKDIVKLEYRMLHKTTNEYVWLESTESVFERDEDGKVKTTVGIARNITKSKKDQYELVHTNKELASKVEQLSALNEELNTFNYSVSHDLRQPVRSIHGLTQLLVKKRGANMEEQEQSIFAEILKQTQSMETLIHDLLKYTQTGNEALKANHIDMQKLCQEVFDSLIAETGKEKINFTLNTIPSIFGDITLITSLWMNLLSNAIKYRSEERSLNIEVGTISNKEESFVTYFVKDNGIGFEAEKYGEKIFDLFERLDVNSGIAGTGVGLSIASKVVRKHGGQIWAESQLDRGTIFYFSLPTKLKNDA